MMLRVSKCLCCCSLKHGVLTYMVLFLIYRVCSATLFLFLDPRQYGLTLLSPIISAAVGYYGATSCLLGVAIKGIIQKKSILLYPYIVILILETIISIFVIVGALFVVSTSTWPYIQLIIVGCINTYAMICLISLYKKYKDYENRLIPNAYELQKV